MKINSTYLTSKHFTVYYSITEVQQHSDYVKKTVTEVILKWFQLR